MKAQTRPPEPEIFTKNSRKWNKQWVELRSKNPSANFSWYTVKGKTAREWALPALFEMNQGHCCFCDNFPLDDGDKPVEHFRPKSNPAYYNLAFTWSNLYFCCSTCNDNKNDFFSEQLLAPDELGFDEHRFFLFDFTNGGILVNPAATKEDQDRALTTIKTFGLDTPSKRRIRKYEIAKWENENDPSMIDDYAFRSFLQEEELPI